MSGSGGLLTPGNREEISALLTQCGADGWLLYDFHDQNPLAQRLLAPGRTTRQAFALFPRHAEPTLVRHEIEASAWTRWPWESRVYRGWRELAGVLGDLIAKMDVLAMEVSMDGTLPSVDRVPYGVVEWVRSLGPSIVSSAELVTALHSRWSSSGLALHKVSAEIVRRTAMAAFDRSARAVSDGSPLRETELMDWIRGELRSNGLADQEDCIVAGGARTADPHYEPSGGGELLEAGDVVLIDVWGRQPPDGIPADQTWMGFLGSQPPDRLQELWSGVREARDTALAFLSERAARRESVCGWEVDRVARQSLAKRALDSWFVHRLGHSIDSELHGAGPNLDDLETHDERQLIPGIGFSVEPGVYVLGELGVRSEVNVYWGTDGPLVTPGEIQEQLLVVRDT